MKTTLLLSICVMFATAMAFAQPFIPPGNIGIYDDPSGANCTVTATDGEMLVYIVHTQTPSTTGCRFSLGFSGAAMTHVATIMGTGNTLLYGDASSGVGISYGVCRCSPIYVAMVLYAGGSTPDPCDLIFVLDDPTANPPGIYMTDCTSPEPVQREIGRGGAAYINDGVDGSHCPCNIPVEETTWGKVKALYQ